MNLKSVLIIANPVAGKLAVEKNLPGIKEVFNKHGIDTRTELTEKRFDARDLAAKYGREHEAVVCVGGDGTLNEVLCGIAGSGHKTPIGYIPAGTTNDFASTLGLSSDMTEAAENIIKGVPTPWDIGKFGDRYFSYVASFGAFTDTSYATSQKMKNRFGHSAYMMSSVKSLFHIKPVRMEVSCGDTVFSGNYMFGAVCNSTSIGGLFKLDPKTVDVKDGLFETFCVENAGNIFTLLKRVADFKGMKYPSDTIHCAKASRITISAEEEMDWSLDGEHAAGGKEVVIENLKQYANFILDPDWKLC